MQTPATQASQPAPAALAQAPRLTIDTGGLKDLFLPIYRTSDGAAEELLKLYRARKKESPAKEAILQGYCILKREADETVACIVRRGGLLLIGGAA